MAQPAEPQRPPDQQVRILAAPWRDFVGAIKGELPERGKVIVILSVFGRPMRVEVDREQVVKV